MPVRVLDRLGRGRADDIAKGIRFAADHHADVINMSFNFGCGKRVPERRRSAALRDSQEGWSWSPRSGNLGSEACVSPPATIPGVIGVGGTTEGGCLGDYSLTGKDVDLVAPGGGEPVASCDSVLNGPIYQVTFKGAEREPLRRARLLRRHLDGGGPCLRRRGDGARQRRRSTAARRDGTLEAQVATQAEENRAQHRPARRCEQGAGLIDAAGRPLPAAAPLLFQLARAPLRSCGR